MKFKKGIAYLLSGFMVVTGTAFTNLPVYGENPVKAEMENHVKVDVKKPLKTVVEKQVSSRTAMNTVVSSGYDEGADLFEGLKSIDVPVGQNYKDLMPKKVKARNSDEMYDIEWEAGETVATIPGKIFKKGKVTVKGKKYDIKLQITVVAFINTDSLKDLISECTNFSNVDISEKGDGSDIDSDTYWVKKSDRSTFRMAISDAEDVLKSLTGKKNTTENKEKLEKAIVDLTNARQVFEKAKKLGTKSAGKPEVKVPDGKADAEVTLHFRGITGGTDEEFTAIKLNLKDSKGKKYECVKAEKDKEDSGASGIAYKYSFTDLPMEKTGTYYQIITPEGYVLTEPDGKVRAVSRTYGFMVLNDTGLNYHDYYLKKGIKVTYDAGEHGKIYGQKEYHIYYLAGENYISADKPPYVDTEDTWSFTAWEKNGTIVALEKDEVKEECTLVAKYTKNTTQIKPDQDIGGGWKLRDFKYGTDPYGQVSITGFSSDGLVKLKDNQEIFLPKYNIYGEQIKSIGYEAFQYNEGNLDDLQKKGLVYTRLKSVKIPEGYEEIHASAFCYNSLKTVTIPSTVRVIGISAFFGNNLQSVNIEKGKNGEGLKYIREYAFTNNKISSLKVPGCVEVIGDGVFADNSISQLELEEGIKRIEGIAFDNNELTEVTIPDSLEYLAQGVFNHNPGIRDNDAKKNGKVIVHTKNGNKNFLSDGEKFIIDPDSKQKNNGLDYKELKNAIANANKMKANVEISENGEDVEPYRKWTSKVARESFEKAILKAKEDGYKAQTSEEITNIVKELTNATNLFESQKKLGTKTNSAKPGKHTFADLKKLYDEAEKLKKDTAVSEDGKDVEKDKYWAKKDAVDKLVKDGLADAKVALTNRPPGPSQERIDEAYENLKAAYDAFNNVRKLGLKENSGGSGGSGSSGGSSSSGGSGGSGGSSSSGGSGGSSSSNTADNNSGKDTAAKQPKTSQDKGKNESIDSVKPVDNAPAEKVAGFSDVTTRDWFAAPVQYVVKNNIMNGTENGFAPNRTTTRAMIATILYRLEGTPKVTEKSKFMDVEAGQWYADSIAYGVKNGILNGISDKEFAPKKNISREEMAVMLFRYAKMKHYDASIKGTLENFADNAEVSSYARDAMKWCVDKGIINGKDGKLAPKSFTTRAEAAAMMERFMKNVVKVA